MNIGLSSGEHAKCNRKSVFVGKSTVDEMIGTTLDTTIFNFMGMKLGMLDGFKHVDVQMGMKVRGV